MAQGCLSARINSGVAMLFYIPSGIWVEEQLAQRLYPEALLKDEEGALVTKVGYVTGYDTTCRVFPFGNNYAEVLRKDMRLVVEELDMQGFAFDVSGGEFGSMQIPHKVSWRRPVGPTMSEASLSTKVWVSLC